jgi:hypothetical protein
MIGGAATAMAHPGASSTFEVRAARTVDGPGLHVVLRLDADVLREVAGDELMAYVDEHFVVEKGGAVCARAVVREVTTDEEADVTTIDVVYGCAGVVTIASTLFGEGEPHRVVGIVHAGGRTERLLFTRHEWRQTVDVPPVAAGGFRTATPPDGAFEPSPSPSPSDPLILSRTERELGPSRRTSPSESRSSARPEQGRAPARPVSKDADSPGSLLLLALLALLLTTTSRRRS